MLENINSFISSVKKPILSSEFGKYWSLGYLPMKFKSKIFDFFISRRNGCWNESSWVYVFWNDSFWDDFLVFFEHSLRICFLNQLIEKFLKRMALWEIYQEELLNRTIGNGYWKSPYHQLVPPLYSVLYFAAATSILCYTS